MKEIRYVSADEAVQYVKSNDHVHISSAASTPQVLIDALCRRGESGALRNVRIHHIFTSGEAPYADERFKNVFFTQAFFISANVRKNVQKGWADYIPVFLSETQRLYRTGIIPLDVAMIMVSPPDRHGFVSLGTAVDITSAAIEKAKTVIAVENSHVPRAWGHAIIPADMIDVWVKDDRPLVEVPCDQPTDIENQIGRHCATLVEDGACLQMGIGSIPNSVLTHLGDHKDLGIHTEMFSDGVLPLIEKGVVNGHCKKVCRDKVVTTFALGTKPLYDFLDDNPMVLVMDASFTNDPYNIARNPKVCAINSALQVDISGQVCADSIGTMLYSGVGGQIDFIQGASMSEGGRSIIAMTSATGKGVSKIVPALAEGAGVVTTRNQIHYLVTEYGAVDLYGKSLQERAKLIISVAHPDAREELERAAYDRFGPHFFMI